MSDERRTSKRVDVHLPARWESITSGAHKGTVSDISTGGCFVMTSGRVAVRDPIKVEMQLPTERWIYLWGVVVHHTPEVGFALRFTVNDEKERTMLALLMEYVDEQP